MNIIKWFKRDYESVAEGLMYLTNGKFPKWVLPMYYIIFLPVGIVLYPFVLLLLWMVNRKIKKYLK